MCTYRYQSPYEDIDTLTLHIGPNEFKFVA